MWFFGNLNLILELEFCQIPILMSLFHHLASLGFQFLCMNKLILLLFLFFISNYVFTPSTTLFPRMLNLSEFNTKCEKIRLNWINVPQLILFGFGLVSALWLFLQYSCNQVKYIMFNTNLNSLKKSRILSFRKAGSTIYLCCYGCCYVNVLKIF